MAMIGYARLSSTAQDTALQISELEAVGSDTIRQEKKSGTTCQGRSELTTILDFIREGDVLVVSRLDRLARSVCDLSNIVTDLERRGGEAAYPQRLH